MGGIGLGPRHRRFGGHAGEPDVQFVAVCEVRKSRRDAIKAMVDGRYGSQDCATYTDIRHFLAERTDLDACSLHGRPLARDRLDPAMRAGKDVFCEKPSCLTMAEGQKVVETARNTAASTRPERNGSASAPRVCHRDGRTGASARSTRPMPIFAGATDASRLVAGRTGAAQGGSRLGYWLGRVPAALQPGYVNGGGWYHFYDFATDVAMWERIRWRSAARPRAVERDDDRVRV